MSDETKEHEEITATEDVIVSDSLPSSADELHSQVIDESDPDEMEALVEALIFANGEPLGISDIMDTAKISQDAAETAMARIQEKFSKDNSGFEVVKVAGQYQFRTKQQFAPFIRELKADKPRRLSNAALETLSVVAYRQPVVKSDIEKIRGVDVSPTLKTLLERSLVKIVGHQPSVGQPALYGTTEEFLKLFGLNSLSELPTLRDISEFEKEPGEVKGEESQPRGESWEGPESVAP